MLSRIFPAARLLDMPNALTIINATLGVLAVGLAHGGHLQLCASLIFLAAMFDYLDGHLARAYFNKQTENREFGKQLDTLADLLNFGVAPAVSILETFTNARLALLVCILLALSSVLRLALFNVLPEKKTPGYVGVPTTYTGFLLANALFLHASQQLPENTVLGMAAILAIMQVLNIPIKKLPAPTITPIMTVIFSTTVIYSKLF